MTELPGVMGLLRLADSALPVGGYTLSHGLESYAAAGLVTDPTDLETLLLSYFVDALAPTDAVACAAAWTAAVAGDLPAVAAVDHRLHALKLAREGREAATRTGRRLLALAAAWDQPPALAAYREWVRQGRAPGCYAVVYGVAAAGLGAPRAAATAAYLHAALLGLLAAAQRLTSLDHERAQAILHRLGPVLAEATERALATDWPAMGSGAPELEIMAMRHERAFVRLFAS
jgi:urease accessory protein